MKKRQWLVSMFALVLLAGTVGFSIATPRNQKAAYQEAPAPEPPEQVIYSAFFHYVADLKQQAAELESEGAKGDSLRVYVQIHAGLDYEEARKLDEIASSCVEEVSQQDAKAVVVIEKFRSRFPEGKVPRGVKVPPPPPELRILQRERDAIILRARDNLRRALGDTGFNKVVEYIDRDIAPSIRAIPVNR
jgi:hypothetical protein